MTGPRDLTPRQAEILRWIRDYVARAGFSPSFREIGEAHAIKSPNGVRANLDALAAKGFITWVPKVARSIVLTGADRQLAAWLADALLTDPNGGKGNGLDITNGGDLTWSWTRMQVVEILAKVLGGPPETPKRKRCPDCAGSGEEQIPCGAGDAECEMCDGTGYVSGPLSPPEGG